MFAKVSTAHLEGIEPVLVEVEVNISNMGLPSFTVVGLAETSIKESRERVKSALKNLGFNIFAKPITINLAPADFKKEGTHYDLPISIGLLAASGFLNAEMDDTFFIGEVSLDGKLRGVKGVLPFTIFAKENGFKKIIVPKENINEAAIIDGIEIYGFDSLDKVLAFLAGEMDERPIKKDITELLIHENEYHDFEDVKGQFAVKRAAEIAAAGMHNLLMIGSPGSGKTMIAKRIPSILPEMTLEEIIETTKIHSVAGRLINKNQIVSKRPFIAPHHTASDVSIIGGGRDAKPGAVSLAHNGILFCDELLEFKKSVLEVLRQPLEDRVVTVSRANRTVTYPANFMFVAACNPCPCGYLGDNRRECVCTQAQIQRYRAKLSGPLMDRIDIQVQVSSIDIKDLSKLQPGESSENIRKRVEVARKIQMERFKEEGILYNSQMNEKQIRKYCRLDESSLKLMEQAVTKLGLSARAYSKILKVARTIADLEESKDLLSKHILEAIQYRILDKENL
ncbi:YifB family Mg chelatase-like AAA ATPase [Deferribacter autotrophicus]|uniref:YifB family Mg chelatase-like AAA ATPase n=1 Tax=Deferribacter autotrophicus TaxID=500465 RepID=A0A5A8F215_9BACT|nr:YifB family Mg chelatase-like AAA ATPase [Deferribacter autotrophicus]KAA0257781.1 YifB family Mg chelatase-like AAA ATPase [Deferribacter autotrophicus]